MLQYFSWQWTNMFCWVFSWYFSLLSVRRVRNQLVALLLDPDLLTWKHDLPAALIGWILSAQPPEPSDVRRSPEPPEGSGSA